MQINHVFPNRHVKKILELSREAIQKQQEAGTAGRYAVVFTVGMSFGDTLTDSEALSVLHQIDRALNQFGQDQAMRVNLVLEPSNPLNVQLGEHIEGGMKAVMELEASAAPKLVGIDGK